MFIFSQCIIFKRYFFLILKKLKIKLFKERYVRLENFLVSNFRCYKMHFLNGMKQFLKNTK